MKIMNTESHSCIRKGNCSVQNTNKQNNEQTKANTDKKQKAKKQTNKQTNKKKERQLDFSRAVWKTVSSHDLRHSYNVVFQARKFVQVNIIFYRPLKKKSQANIWNPGYLLIFFFLQGGGRWILEISEIVDYCWITLMGHIFMIQKSRSWALRRL